MENGATNGNGVYDIKSLGSSLKLTKTESAYELTHERAKELLAMPSFVGERGIRKRHIGHLLRHMSQGTFQWNLVNVVICRCAASHNGHQKGLVYRMNGQHTCYARLEMPPSYRAVCQLSRYAAASEADMRRLYATIRTTL